MIWRIFFSESKFFIFAHCVMVYLLPQLLRTFSVKLTSSNLLKVNRYFHEIFAQKSVKAQCTGVKNKNLLSVKNKFVKSTL